MQIDRIMAIQQHLFSKGFSSISDISNAVGASEPTVRRDLLALENRGAIIRIHGGARIAEGAIAEIAFESREQVNLPAKRAIGDAAYKLLVPNTAVFLDAGTTVLQVARQLRMAPLPLRIFTNCLPIAQLLSPLTALTVTLIGGTLRPQNASMVGKLAEDALGHLWFDQVFLGAGAISPTAEIYSADEQEARLNAQMLMRTDSPVLLVDADKFDHYLTHRVAAVQSRIKIVSDIRLDAEWQNKLHYLNCSFVLTKPK